MNPIVSRWFLLCLSFALANCGIVPDGDGPQDPTDPTDECPQDPAKTEPGICGCGISDADTDQDQTPDCLEECDQDPAKTEPGDCGCGVSEVDTDQDQTPDCLEECDADPNKTEPGQCGCGVSEVDTDQDQTPDCLDECDDDPNKTDPGNCGCGEPEGDCDLPDDPHEPPDSVPEPDNALPQPPSILRDVTNFHDGKNTRPHMPPLHSSHDGRVNMAGRGRSKDPAGLAYHFYLLSPERIKTTSFLNSPNQSTLLASPTPLSLKARLFVNDPAFLNGTGGQDQTEIFHSTLCDPGKNPRTCGPAGEQDCYDLTVIAPLRNLNTGRYTLWGTKITVRVDKPKTDQAQIVEVKTQTPKKGFSFAHTKGMLETHVTEDGHMIVARALGVPGGDGFGMLFSNPANTAPCDVTAFRGPFSLNEAPNREMVTKNWHFARYPFRDTRGATFGSAEESRTYPMIDGRGKNVWYYGGRRQLFKIRNGKTVSEFQVKCVPNTKCTQALPPPNEEALKDLQGESLKRLVVVRGVWTGGKAVVIDNVVNNTDYGLGWKDEEHRLIKLYTGNEGWIRVGNGSYNSGDKAMRPVGRIGNSGFMDTTESRFNYLSQMKTPLPRAFSWWFSDGKATDIVVFDDWVNPHVLIYSQMTTSLQRKIADDAESVTDRIQNSACTQRYKVPLFGRINGRGRIEPVALGGVRGKGVWFHQGTGLVYPIPQDQPRSLADEVWYVGLFVDPRFPNDDNLRQLIRFPDNSTLATIGRHSLLFRTQSGQEFSHELERPIPRNAYSHLGFRIQPSGAGVEIFRDGMLAEQWPNPDGINLFEMGSGQLWLGSHGNNTPGFVGWVDEFKVIGRAKIMTDEQFCQHALGSLVGLTTDAPTPLRVEAARYPDLFHDRIDQLMLTQNYPAYLCFDHNRNQDGWVNMNQLPDGVISVAGEITMPEGPFVWDQPRPDSTNNRFCHSCHADDFTGKRIVNMTPKALVPGTVPFIEDPRRSITRPRRRMFGNIPADYFKPGEPDTTIQAPEEGVLVDPFVVK